MMGAVLLGIVCGKRTDMPDRWFRRAYRLLLAVLASSWSLNSRACGWSPEGTLAVT